MGTVYVSSTYQDLVAERAAVRRAIGDLGHQPVGMETYGADEKTVLEKCSSDIDISTAYVLVVGWRYGWQPPGLGGKSITELEWEAAKRAPRLIRRVYIQEDVQKPSVSLFGAKDRKLVEDFRQRLTDPSEPMVGRFATKEDLERRVLADLGPQLGRAAEFPPELRATCDRQDHVTDVQRAWIQGLGKRPPRRGPTVVLLHGEREQGHHLFAERVARRELPRLPRIAGSPALPHPVHLDWSDATDPAQFVTRMQGALWSALSSESRQVWSTTDFVASSVPLVVAVEVPLDGWAKKVRLLEAYAESWCQHPFDQLETPTIVLLYARSSTKSVSSSMAAVAAQLSARSCDVLTMHLDDVEAREALAWARSAEVQRFCRDRDPTIPVEGIFKTKKAWQMEPLMRKLETIVCQLAESQGARR